MTTFSDIIFEYPLQGREGGGSIIYEYRYEYDKYTSSFTEEDWVLDGDFYYLIFNHNLSARPVIVQLWKNNALVFPDSVEIIDDDNIKIKVSSDPDNKFAGDIIVIKGKVYDKYTSSFTEEDWVLDGDFYYITFNHNLNAQPVLVQLWENNVLVFPDNIEIIDNNNVKIKVPSDPSNKFAGDIIVIKGEGHTGEGPSGSIDNLQQLLQPLWYLIY